MSSTLRFNLNDPDIQLSQLLSNAPTVFKTQFGLGLKSLSRLTATQVAALLEIVMESIASPAAIDDKDTPSEFGVSPDEFPALLVAANVIAVTLGTSSRSAAQMAEELSTSKLIAANETPPIRYLEAVAQNRDAIKRSLQRSTLGAQFLPSLTDFEAAVDLRPAFDKETKRITFAVPVLIVHIDTDSYGEEIWLQLNKRQLTKTIENLQTALLQMEEAERWSNEAGLSQDDR